jgi:hypothetical protein
MSVCTGRPVKKAYMANAKNPHSPSGSPYLDAYAERAGLEFPR